MATLLPSAGAEVFGFKPKPEVSRAASPAGTPDLTKAPSIAVPLGFIVLGLACLAGAVSLIVLQPAILSTYHYNQYVVAAAHLALLGWIASVVFGALYQLVPVALETRLFSERLAFAHLLCHAVGALGMVWSFWHWNLKHVGHWGSVFAVGVALLFVNIAVTTLRSRKWTPVSVGISSAVVWLGLTVTVGLAVATAKCSYGSIERMSAANPLAITLRGLEAVSGFMARFDQMSMMHTHAHLGALGCFVLLIVTISFKLLPMFLLSEVRSPRRAWWIIGLLNGGLLGLAFTMATRNPWKLLFAGVLLGALILYAIELRAILRARKRRVLDPALRMFMGGLTMLLPLGGLAVVLSWPRLPLTVFTGQLENLYGFLAVFGLITTALLGMLFKILPFLVWYGTYSIHLGRARVPNLAEMYSEKLLHLGGIAWFAALIVVAAGILTSHALVVRWGGAVMALGIVLHLVNYARIISHRLRPRLQPLTAPPAPSK